MSSFFRQYRTVVLLSVLVALSYPAAAQNQAPSVSKVVVRNDPANHRATIRFFVSDPDDKVFAIRFLVSADSGKDFSLNIRHATGSLGEGMAPGKQEIIWNYGADAIDAGKCLFRIVVSDNYHPDLHYLLGLIDTTKMKETVQQIVNTTGTKEKDTVLNRAGRIRNVIEGYCAPRAFTIRKQDFVFGDYTGENIICAKQGTTKPDELTAVCACIDLTENKPSANSNGSGLAGMLAIADVISKLQFKRTIQLLGMDYSGEEFIGSNQYVFHGGIRDYEKMTGVLDLDRIGSYSEEVRSHRVEDAAVELFPTVYKKILADSARANFLTVVSNERSHDLASSFMKNAVEYFPNLKVYNKEFPDYGELSVGETDFVQFSEHIPFWYRRYQALWITDAGATARINGGAEDKMDKIHFPFLTDAVRLCLLNLIEMGQIDHAGVYQSSF